MTKETGKSTFKARPTDAEAWNKEVAALRKRVIDRHGEGTVAIVPESDFGGVVHWTWRPAPVSLRAVT